MKNVLKIVALLLSLCMAFAMVACGAKTADVAGEPVAEEPVAEENVAEEEAIESDLADIQKKGTLVVGITDYAPMDYKDDNNEWTGFDAEFARLVAAELGVTAEFIEIDWDNKFFELESGSIDCIWNGMTITEEALANASVSDAYVVNAQVVVMSKDILDNYADEASLAELNFAVENGSAGAECAEALGLNINAVDTQSTALMEVASGSADACIIDITMANAMTGEGTSYADLGYKLALSSEEYGIAFRKTSDVTAKVNELMASMKADGRLQELADKYELTLAD